MTIEDLQGPDAGRYDISNRMLAVLTVAGAGGLSVATILPHVLALSLCSALLTSIALLVIEHAITSIRDYKPSMSNGPSPIIPMRPRSNTVIRSDAWLVSLRDTSAVVAPACFVLAFIVERSFRTDTIYHGLNNDDAVGVWEHPGWLWALQYGLQLASMSAVKHLTLFSMVSSGPMQFPAASTFALSPCACCLYLGFPPYLQPSGVSPISVWAPQTCSIARRFMPIPRFGRASMIARLPSVAPGMPYLVLFSPTTDPTRHLTSRMLIRLLL